MGSGLSSVGPSDASGVISGIASGVAPSVTANLVNLKLVGVAILGVIVLLAIFTWLRRVIAGVDEKLAPVDNPYFDDWTEGYGEVSEEMAAACMIWISYLDDRHSGHDEAMTWLDGTTYGPSDIAEFYPDEEIEVQPDEYEAHTGEPWMTDEEMA